MTLHLVWDTSGSMAEWGKTLIARGVVRAIEQYLRLGYGCAELSLVAWGDVATVVEWQPDHEFPPEVLVCKGEANVGALIAHLAKQPLGKIVLLTDGFWARSDARALKRWKDGLPPDTVRLVRVGADSNQQLKGDDVFPAEGLFAALDGWLEGGAV